MSFLVHLRDGFQASAVASVKQPARRKAAQVVQSGTEVECIRGGSGQGRGLEGMDLPRPWRARFCSGPKRCKLAQRETRGNDCRYGRMPGWRGLNPQP